MKLRIEMGPAGWQTKVFVDDVDISSTCRLVEVKAEVGDVTHVVVEHVLMNDGRIVLDMETEEPIIERLTIAGRKPVSTDKWVDASAELRDELDADPGGHA